MEYHYLSKVLGKQANPLEAAFSLEVSRSNWLPLRKPKFVTFKVFGKKLLNDTQLLILDEIGL